ncbi:MAG: universal stress protein [Desulfocapsa sp.]|nr:universal stress protein [Desulfocapsa sp.]
MQEIHQILVPVDFSKTTAQLVDYACYVAEKLSATIHFVHVSEINQGHDMLLGSSVFGGIKEQIIDAAEERMANLLVDNSGRCKGCTGKVVEGDIVDAIIDQANINKSDLIIISTHGTKGLEKILLGSIAERVIKKAPCPTLSYNPYK